MAALDGIWPELLAAWRLRSMGMRSRLGGCGTAATSFAGVGYYASVHRDKNDNGFTIAKTFHRPKDMHPDTSHLAIPAFGVSRPSLSFPSLKPH